MRRILLVLSAALMMAGMVVATAVPAFADPSNPSSEKDRCSKFSEGFIIDCRGGSGGGGSFDADHDGVPDGGQGGGAGQRSINNIINQNANTSSGGRGFGTSDPEFSDQAPGGRGKHCTSLSDCVGGSSPSWGL